MAINRIDNSVNRLSGRGIALAGAILGGVGLVFWLISFALLLAIMLPAISPDCRTARQMQNNTQGRGIQ